MPHFQLSAERRHVDPEEVLLSRADGSLSSAISIGAAELLSGTNDSGSSKSSALSSFAGCTSSRTGAVALAYLEQNSQANWVVSVVVTSAPASSPGNKSAPIKGVCPPVARDINVTRASLSQPTWVLPM